MAEERQNTDDRLGSDILRYATKFETVGVLLGVSLTLFGLSIAQPNSFGIIQNYSGVSTAMFMVALLLSIPAQANFRKYNAFALWKLLATAICFFLLIGAVHMALIVYQLSIGLGQISTFMMAGLFLFLSAMFLWASRLRYERELIGKKEMSLGWLKFVMTIMASLMATIIMINYLSQSFTGMDFFPMPDNLRGPLLFIGFVSAYGSIGIAEESFKTAKVYFANKKK